MKESRTTYSYLIEHMQNPTFLKVWDVAFDFVQKLPAELCEELHDSLNRGVDVLDSEPLLQMYIYSYGKMHKAKLYYAFDNLHENVFKYNEVEIVDYGCGQGLATICYHDYIIEHNTEQHVKKITLIEPSKMALSRAELLCSTFFPEAEIVAINKQFDELTVEDLLIYNDIPTIHLFSNILDVESYDLTHLSRIVKEQSVGENEYILVSPMQSTKRVRRLKKLASNIDKVIYFERYLEKRELQEGKDWTCAVLLCSDAITAKKSEGTCHEIQEEASLCYPNGKEKEIVDNCFFNSYEKLQLLAENGDVKKQVELARYYKKNKQYDLEFLWFDKAARQGDADGINGVGCCYCEGRGVQKDVKKGIRLIIEAANKGSFKAQHNLAVCYVRGIGVELNWEKAFELYYKLAENGDADSQYMVGKYYMHNQAGSTWHIISQRDTKKAFYWYTKAAEQGYAKAQKEIGFFYETGLEPCNKNLENAIKWYTKAAEHGIVDAILAIGRLYLNGINGQNSDMEKAFVYFLEAAEKCNSEAQYRVGVSLYYGRGCDVDRESAVKWLTKAYEQGNEAAYNLLCQINEAKGVNDETELNPTGITSKDMLLGKMDSYGVLFSQDGKKLLHYGIDDVAESDDYGNIKGQVLKYYEVPEGVEIICDEAFQGCESIVEIYLPSSLKEIGERAFSECINLESIVIPVGVKIIRNSTFRGCTALENFVIPYTLEEIHEDALIGIKDVQSFSPNFIVKNGVLFSGDLTTLIYFIQDGKTSYEIPHGTKIIGDYSFSTSAILQVTIPNTVTRIGKYAFNECNNLIKIELPPSITEIGLGVFSNCENLCEITLPHKIKQINAFSFCGCNNLKEVSIPDGVSEIGFEAFSSTDINTVCLPYHLAKLEPMAFVGAPLISIRSNSVYLKVEGMTIYSNDGKELIQYYGHDVKFIVPNTVVKIAKCAFACAYSLKELYIPSSVQEIGVGFLEQVCPNKIVIPAKLKEEVMSRVESYLHENIFIEEDDCC